LGEGAAETDPRANFALERSRNTAVHGTLPQEPHDHVCFHKKKIMQ